MSDPETMGELSKLPFYEALRRWFMDPDQAADWDRYQAVKQRWTKQKNDQHNPGYVGSWYPNPAEMERRELEPLTPKRNRAFHCAIEKLNEAIRAGRAELLIYEGRALPTVYGREHAIAGLRVSGPTLKNAAGQRVKGQNKQYIILGERALVRLVPHVAEAALPPPEMLKPETDAVADWIYDGSKRDEAEGRVKRNRDEWMKLAVGNFPGCTQEQAKNAFQQANKRAGAYLKKGHEGAPTKPGAGQSGR